MTPHHEAARKAAEEIQKLNGDKLDRHCGIPHPDGIAAIILKHFPATGGEAVNTRLLEAAKLFAGDIVEPDQTLKDCCVFCGQHKKHSPECKTMVLRDAIASAASQPPSLEDELAEACIMAVGFISTTAPHCATLGVLKAALNNYNARKEAKTP